MWHGMATAFLTVMLLLQPACASFDQPAAKDGGGLFMCSCGQVYMITTVDGEISIKPIDMSGKAPQPDEHPFKPQNPTERAI